MSYFRRIKYNNTTCKCHSGHIHDSRGEAAYCDNLTLLIKAGEIQSFEIQKTYDLIVNGKKICGHRVDFVVVDKDGNTAIHEFKGFATEVWRIKHKLFEAIYPNLPYIVVRFIAAIFLLTVAVNAEAKELKVNIMKIAKIESNFNTHAVNLKEGSRGLCQIRAKGALADWNSCHKDEQYTADDLFDREINLKIAEWYINVRIPSYIRHYHRPDTIENRLVAYNAGIRYVKDNIPIPNSTKRYIEKYKALSSVGEGA